MDKEKKVFGKWLADWLFTNPVKTLVVILMITIAFAIQIPGMKLASNFDDLLPATHPYVNLHQEVREIFGGANILTVIIEVKEGTIFTNETLAQIQRVTEAVDSLPGVNHNMIHSLTYHTTRRLSVDSEGSVKQSLYYDPGAKPLTTLELEQLRGWVQVDPRVYGHYVSPDLKLARITANMNTSESSVMIAAFEGMQKIRKAESNGGTIVYAVGNPILTGWVYSYFSDITQVLLYTLALVILLLVLYFRKLTNVLLPLAGITMSSAWGLGFLNLSGITLDPVSMPIVFLLAARATSHGVQIVERFNYELARCLDNKLAARQTFSALIRPGGLAITTDAIGIVAISFGSAPYHTNLATYAGFWAVTIVFSVNVMLPVLLTAMPQPKDTTNKRESTSAAVRSFLKPYANPLTGKLVLGGASAIVLVALCFVPRLEFGNADGGSPLLHQSHEYNRADATIADRFPGAEPLFIIARVDQDLGRREVGKESFGGQLAGNVSDGVRDPDVLMAIDALDRYMLESPAVHGSRTISSLVKQVNRLLYEGDPRWAQVPDEAVDAGGTMFAYEFAAPHPNALREYVDSKYLMSNLAFFLPDARAATINEALGTAKQYAPGLAEGVDGLQFELAAGSAGVNAAINEANYTDTITVTVFVLLAIFIVVAWNYRSAHAGLMMLIAMGFAVATSYGYMGLAGVGVHANIIPVIAIGIGMGIDYAIYTVDRVRSEVVGGMDLQEAVIHAMSTTGVAVSFTVLTLISGVIMWVFSELRFQSESAILLVVMISMFAVGALLLMPAWILVFKPKFICSPPETSAGV